MHYAVSCPMGTGGSFPEVSTDLITSLCVILISLYVFIA
jgi:hypothetical protein